MADEKYWAGESLDEFLPKLWDRIDHYYAHVEEIGLLRLWRASHAADYSGFYVGGRINEAGPNGKFQSMEANEYRNLKTHVLNMITAQKSQPEAQAQDMDHESQQQVQIANGLAETISEAKQLERIRQEVADKGLAYGEGWGVPLWNKALGDVYSVAADPVLDEHGQPTLDEQGQPQTNEKPLHEGDLEFFVQHPLDTVRDYTRTTSLGQRWLTSRRYANRWALCEAYPKYADDIVKIPSAVEVEWSGKRPRLYQGYTKRTDDCDEVIIWEFMHEKLPGLQGGRIVLALAPDLAIEDDALPYRELPHQRWAASDIDGLPFGYSLFFDLLALQQGINAGLSGITTRMATFGLPAISGGASMNIEKLPEGMTSITSGPNEPEPKLIELANISEGALKFIELLRSLSATYSGINNVARGQPEGGVTAASALALLEARAIQFVALVQKADIEFMKRLYTASLWHLQDNAVADVLVKMTGKSNRSRVKTFKAAAFGKVTGYTMKIGNALQSTTAGRLQLADGMKAAGVQVTPEQYIQVATTGKSEPITRGPQSEQELIEAENEQLQDGIPQRALRTDKHALHIDEHKVVVNDPEVRKIQDSPIVEATLSHIAEHEQMLAAIMAPPMPPPAPVAPGHHPLEQPPAQAGAPPVKVERAQPAKNPVTGQPNPTSMAAA